MGGTRFEIGTIEGTIRIDDHESDAPLEDSSLIELWVLLAGRTDKGSAEWTYLDVDPFLPGEVLVFLHQTLFRRHDWDLMSSVVKTASVCGSGQKLT
jgi:hypothetical protein